MPSAAASVVATNAGDRMAVRAGGAVFWSLVLLIIMGRVYAYDMPVVSNTVATLIQVLASR